MRVVQGGWGGGGGGLARFTGEKNNEHGSRISKFHFPESRKSASNVLFYPAPIRKEKWQRRSLV